MDIGKRQGGGRIEKKEGEDRRGGEMHILQVCPLSNVYERRDFF